MSRAPLVSMKGWRAIVIIISVLWLGYIAVLTYTYFPGPDTRERMTRGAKP
jgi:hypothetical protein